MNKSVRITLIIVGFLILIGGLTFVAIRLEPWLSAKAAYQKVEANIRKGKYTRAFYYAKMASDKKPDNVQYAWTATQMSVAIRNANAAFFYAQRAWKDGRKERDVLLTLVQFTFFPDKKQKLDYAMSLIDQMGGNIEKDDVRADLYEGFGEIEKARQVREQLFNKTPLPAWATKLARIHLKAGKDTTAFLFLNSCRKQHQLNDEGYALLARLYAKKGDVKEAERCYQEGSEANSSSDRIEYDHALFLMATKNFDRATSMLDSLSAKYPENISYESTRISVLMAKGDIAGALRECDKSNAPIGLIAPLRARALFRLNRLAEAEAAYDTALSHNPGIRVRLEFGNFLLNTLHKSDKAINIFQSVLKVQPTEPVANWSLATIALNANDFVRARKHAESILSGKKPTPLAHLLLAQINLKEGKPQAALENCNKTLAVLPGFEKALFLQAVSFDLLDRLEKADEILSILARKQRKNSEQWMQTKRALIGIKMKQKKYPEALQIANEIDPIGKDVNMGRIRLEIYGLSGNFAKADELLASLNSSIGKNRILFYQSWLAELRGDTLGAAAILESDLASKNTVMRWAALRLKIGKTDDVLNRLPKDSMNVADWLQLAAITDRSKLYPFSAQFYKNALQLNSENAAVLNNYVWACMQTPGFDKNEVLVTAKKAYLTLSDRPEALQTYAEALNKCDKPADCIKLLQDKTAQTKQSADLLYQLGAAYEKIGDMRGALSSYRMALSLPETTPDWPSDISRAELLARTEQLTLKVTK